MVVTTQRLQSPPLGEAVERRTGTARHATPRGADIRFATVTDLTTFEALRLDWSSLFEASGAPHQVFQTFDWLAIWVSLYINASTRLSVVTGRVGGRLVIVWPLVIRKAYGLSILSAMGEPLSQYGDALMALELDETAADAAFDYIMALPVDVIALRRVRDDAALAPVLRRRLGAPDNRQEAPFIDLSDVCTAVAFEKRFSSKLRGSRRRRRRRLEERGAISFHHYKPSSEAAALVATALYFKREWARQTGVIAPALQDPRFEQFFVAAALAGQRAPELRVSVLRVGDDIVGIEISVLCKGHLVGHVLAPHPGFGQLGLGGILAESTILNALDKGYAAVDLLAPADAYKSEWTTASVGVGDYIVAKTTLGVLYTRLWLCFGRDALKAIACRLRPVIAIVSRRPRRAS